MLGVCVRNFCGVIDSSFQGKPCKKMLMQVLVFDETYVNKCEFFLFQMQVWKNTQTLSLNS